MVGDAELRCLTTLNAVLLVNVSLLPMLLLVADDDDETEEDIELFCKCSLFSKLSVLRGW